MKDLQATIPAHENGEGFRLYDLESSMLLISQKSQGKSELWKIVKFSKPRPIHRENYIKGQNVSEDYILSGNKRYPVGTTEFEPEAVFMNLHRIAGKTSDGRDRVTGSVHLVGNQILKWFRDEKLAVKVDEFGAPEMDNRNIKAEAAEERRARRTTILPAAMAGRK